MPTKAARHLSNPARRTVAFQSGRHVGSDAGTTEAERRSRDGSPPCAATRSSTPPDEEPFQRIVELVRTVLGVPDGRVSLIDGNRAVAARRRGGPLRKADPARRRVLQRDHQQPGPMAVTDAAADGRFAGNPLVIGAPHIRSYLGVPLTTPDGYNIGTLCAIDNEPRPVRRARGRDPQKARRRSSSSSSSCARSPGRTRMTGALTRRGFFAEVEQGIRPRPPLRPAIGAGDDRRRPLPATSTTATATRPATPCCRHRQRRAWRRCASPTSSAASAAKSSPCCCPRPTPGTRLRRRRAHPQVRRRDDRRNWPGRDVRATVSCGVAPLPSRAEGAAGWFAEADIALYEAKHFGRNRRRWAEAPLRRQSRSNEQRPRCRPTSRRATDLAAGGPGC